MKNGSKKRQLQNEKLLSSQRVVTYVFRMILIIFLNNTKMLCVSYKLNPYVI
jgi:hypothetical protein